MATSEDILQRYYFFRRILIINGDSSGLESIQREIYDILYSSEDKSLLFTYFPTIVRFSIYSPIKEVQDTFTEIVQAIQKVMDMSSVQPKIEGPSHFLLSKCTMNCENEDEELTKLLQWSFYTQGRVPNLTRILSLQRPFLKCYMKTMKTLMEDDGPLPLSWRHYLAIMAASQLRCGVLVSLHQQQFLLNDGDAKWLVGLEEAPEKLEKLADINMLLAHRPWLVNKDHIRALRSQHGDAWSVSELVHAVVILCTFHSLSCLAWGVGCASELDLPEVLQLSDRSSNSDGSDVSDNDIASIERDEAILKQRLMGYVSGETMEEVEENLNDEEQFTAADNNSRTSPTSRIKNRHNFWKYCSYQVMIYEDFDVKSKEYRVLHAGEYSWEDHCFPLLQRYFPTLAPLLDEQFSLIFSLTYNSFGEETNNIDTTPYRRAIWYYVHRMEGISHDDYNYSEVNAFLNRPTKCYIKKIACFPFTVRKRDFEHFDRSITEAEKVHVNLLVAEARKQAGLLYGLHAIMKYML